MEIDQEELDGYILSAYSYYAKSQGELSGAINAAFDKLLHSDSSVLLEYMRDLKSITVEKLQDFADIYAKLVTQGMRFTAGGSSAINENAEFFDTILSPFEEEEEIELEDVKEDLPHYEAVTFVIDYGLMYPADKTIFGVDNTATMGDAAIALYALGIDEEHDPEIALNEISGYGILPGSAVVDDPLTGAAFEDALAVFSSLVGVPYEKSGADDSVLTRGELAELIMNYTMPLLG